jgi:CRP/FNR family cyclic AMP-dependent transcriptional regulator
MAGETMSDQVLKTISLFEDFSAEQLEQVSQLFVPCSCHAGTVIFEQGDPADYLYTVVSGEVLIRYKPDDGPPINITRLRDGCVFGWSALIKRRKYTSSVECAVHTQLLRVSSSDLQNLCEKYPETGTIILDRLIAAIIDRLRATSPEMYALLESSLRNGVNCPGG